MSDDHERPSEEREPSSVTRDIGRVPTLAGGLLAAGDTLHADADAWVPGATLPFLAPAVPQQLGRYVVLGPLGRGGMGTVLEAFDRTLDRRVALKVLHRNLGTEHTKRLLREAQALAKLSHPNVVQVYEVGEAAGQAFIAMELVQGRSLRAWLDRDPPPSWRERVDAFVQAGEGLAAAHAQGLVHRDFKPGNAVIDDAGRVRVLDFGLARRVEDADSSASVEPTDAVAVDEESLTEVGMVVGTPAYMAPEQMRGQEVDARSDQFAYCVALFEALYGERPFEGASMGALLVSLLSGSVRPIPKGSDVPAAVHAVVLRGLAAEPADRWPSMAALLGELRRVTAPPRKRSWLAASMVGGLVVAGLGLWQQAAVDRRCEGARHELEGTWDDARKHEVQAAILATELSYAADTWARVEQRLDGYAEAWAAAYTEACEATSVRQEQSAEVMDLRMACLDERRLALGEAVEVLARADATRVENAVDLVASLPGLLRCDDVEALRAELPPPEDPAVAAQVEEVRTRLARARALRDAGVYDEAFALADAATGQAEALAYPPLRAEALLVRGSAHESEGRYPEAEADVEQAYLVAMEHGYDGVEARAAGKLVRIVGERQARHDAGLQWGKVALAMAHHLRAEPTLEAQALEDVGSVLWRQGKLAEALDHHQRALAIFERELDPDHPDVAGSLNSIGNVSWGQGKIDQALAYHQRAAAIWAQAKGSHHPVYGHALNNIGTVLKDQGKLAEAHAQLERAVEILEQALGPRHPDVAAAFMNIGLVAGEQGKREQALAYHRRAMSIHEQTLGAQHPYVAFSLNNIGNVLAAQGEHAQALDHFQRALAILEQALGPRHAFVAYPLVDMSEVELAQGDVALAREHGERAVSILESTETTPDPLAEGRFALAMALWDDPAQRPRARTLATQARDAYTSLGPAKRAELAKVDAWLAARPQPASAEAE